MPVSVVLPRGEMEIIVNLACDTLTEFSMNNLKRFTRCRLALWSAREDDMTSWTQEI
jgi:hypothetical protein